MNAKSNFIVCVMLLAAGMVYAQETFTVSFTNGTGYDINELFISPSISDDWHEDLLNGLTIRDGATMEVNVPVLEENTETYDILALDIDGDRYTQYEVDLSPASGRTVTMTFDDFAESDDYESGSDDSYDQGYLDGYREAWREAYKEAYSEGYRSGLEDAGVMER